MEAEAVEVARHLFRDHPDQYRAELAAQLASYGKCLSSNGSYEVACTMLAEAVELTQYLYGLYPARFKNALIERLSQYGNLLLSLGRFGETMSQFSEAAILESDICVASLSALKDKLLHMLEKVEVMLKAGKEAGAPMVFHNKLTALALHLPDEIARNWIARVTEIIPGFGDSTHQAAMRHEA
jgi:tetratricopeptide (TPR) repeat protein